MNVLNKRILRIVNWDMGTFPLLEVWKMKKGKFGSCWRPLMGVVAVGVLALGVSALAAPRPVDDSAVRGTNKGKTEVTRLVTGDPAQINAVVAGTPPTAILAITPAPNKGALGPVNPPGVSLSYPGGTGIVGNTLTAPSGGFRAYFDVTVKAWDPNGDFSPGMKTVQVAVNPAGYLGMNASPANAGVDLIPPDSTVCGVASACTAGSCAAGGSAAGEPCLVAADCNAARRCRDNFGEAWAKCDLGFCKAGYVEKAGLIVDHFCTPDVCDNGDTDTSSFLYRFFLIINTDNRVDDDTLDYIGTLALDVPASAKGTYTVDLDHAQTYFEDKDGTRIDTLEENGFVVHIPTGSCCHGLGGAVPTCENNLTKPECDARPASNVWGGEGSVCVLEGSDEGCAACTIAGRNTDPRCNDLDSCTNDDCAFPPGICTHPPITGFNPVKGGQGDTGNCCDGSGSTPVLTDKDDGDVCTCDSCPLEDNHGRARHDPCVVPCDDGNACAWDDKCDGINTEENGGCVGTPVNGQPCLTNDDCTHGGQAPTAVCSANLTCFCTVTPKVTFVLDTTPGKTCDGGFNDGLPCAKDSDCPGNGRCDIFPANCFDEGEKISALVNIGVAAVPINGGQFLILYDPSCVDYNSVVCLDPYTKEVYKSIDEAAGKIFIACGVNPFGGVNGPLGGVPMLLLSFTMIGECNNCFLDFGGDLPPGDPGSSNPLNTYLVNSGGYKVPVETQPKEISENGDLVLVVPDNIKTNSDCDIPAAIVTWDAPSASFSCGDVNLACRGAHESGLAIAQSVVTGGGLLPQGLSSFCCYAWAKDKCEQAVGCPPGAANDCTGPQGGKPTGCWTVEVNDLVSLDIHVQLEPPLAPGVNELERCIEFCLYGPCVEPPYCFPENVLFGGLYNYIGKANGKIKIPKGKWSCITAQDQLHSLRSCCAAPDCIDCIDGQLHADFKGDPISGGNWLIMGNLDGWKKANPDEDPSLDVIDILDYGKFVSQYGICYPDRKYGCHEGPHADIDGDGCVLMSDYNFIIRNFLVSAKDCCCGPQAASLPAPLAEVSVDQLRQMGLGELVVADLNGDGLLNAQDMDAFMQGARPTKTPNDRKGGKGLRSGR
jgi:hypothetical protein